MPFGQEALTGLPSLARQARGGRGQTGSRNLDLVRPFQAREAGMIAADLGLCKSMGSLQGPAYPAFSAHADGRGADGRSGQPSPRCHSGRRSAEESGTTTARLPLEASSQCTVARKSFPRDPSRRPAIQHSGSTERSVLVLPFSLSLWLEHRALAFTASRSCIACSCGSERTMSVRYAIISWAASVDVVPFCRSLLTMIETGARYFRV